MTESSTGRANNSDTVDQPTSDKETVQTKNSWKDMVIIGDSGKGNMTNDVYQYIKDTVDSMYKQTQEEEAAEARRKLSSMGGKASAEARRMRAKGEEKKVEKWNSLIIDKSQGTYLLDRSMTRTSRMSLEELKDQSQRVQEGEVLIQFDTGEE